MKQNLSNIDCSVAFHTKIGFLSILVKILNDYIVNTAKIKSKIANYNIHVGVFPSYTLWLCSFTATLHYYYYSITLDCRLSSDTPPVSSLATVRVSTFGLVDMVYSLSVGSSWHTQDRLYITFYYPSDTHQRGQSPCRACLKLKNGRQTRRRRRPDLSISKPFYFHRLIHPLSNYINLINRHACSRPGGVFRSTCDESFPETETDGQSQTGTACRREQQKKRNRKPGRKS